MEQFYHRLLAPSFMFNELTDIIQSSYAKTNYPYPFNYYIKKSDNSHVFEYALAGFKSDEIDITVDGNDLIITAEPKAPVFSDNIRVIKHGISMKKMVMKLVCDIPELDLTKIKASFVDGLLTITVPESESSKKSRFTVKID